jgi:hypothetical protein
MASRFPFRKLWNNVYWLLCQHAKDNRYFKYTSFILEDAAFEKITQVEVLKFGFVNDAPQRYTGRIGLVVFATN